MTFNIYGFIIGLLAVLGIRLLVYLSPAKLRPLWPRYYLFLLALALIGARLYHVVDKSAYYSKNPFQIIAVWQGGLSIWGALLAFLLGLFYISRRQKIPFLTLSDRLFIVLPLLQAIGRLGNYFNREIIGLPTNLPWAVYLSPQNRPPAYQAFAYFHPVFLYELILDLILFIFLYKLRRQLTTQPGLITALYLIFYGLIRLSLEPLRLPADSFYLGSINVNLILALISVSIGIVLYRKRKLQPTSQA
ncbi:MAG: prolipoprotein diacylglyceryl transferase [bacterium]|nr:prolipoprotein diacylglyceryl transferase [bacterium]